MAENECKECYFSAVRTNKGKGCIALKIRIETDCFARCTEEEDLKKRYEDMDNVSVKSQAYVLKKELEQLQEWKRGNA